MQGWPITQRLCVPRLSSKSSGRSSPLQKSPGPCANARRSSAQRTLARGFWRRGTLESQHLVAGAMVRVPSVVGVLTKMRLIVRCAEAVRRWPHALSTTALAVTSTWNRRRTWKTKTATNSPSERQSSFTPGTLTCPPLLARVRVWAREREIVVYWYSFSNHRTVCIHYGFSLVGNNLNNTLRTP
jgi:hypothetical protein